MGIREKAQVMDQAAIARSLNRIAHEIVERNPDMEELVIVGIRTRGAILAERVAEKLRQLGGREIPLGILDITMYRDDLGEIGPYPVVHKTEIPFDVAQKKIVLIDDVLYTGRTLRAALDALIDFGRPEFIQVAVLVDRGHRELPIRADYVGKNVPTSQEEVVEVQLDSVDGMERVILVEKEG